MPLVILDRDGVINFDRDDYIRCAQQWQAIPGSLSAIARLTQAGVDVAIATNQAGIAKGLYDHNALEQIHEKLIKQVEAVGGRIACICFCPHQSVDNCDCRKPKAGLLRQIAERLNYGLVDVPFVGDKISDLEAALAAGAKPVLVKTGYGELSLTRLTKSLLPEIYEDLSDFVDHYLG